MSLESSLTGELPIKLSITLTHSFVSTPPKKLGTCVFDTLGSSAGLTRKCVPLFGRSNKGSELGCDTLLSPAGCRKSPILSAIDLSAFPRLSMDDRPELPSPLLPSDPCLRFSRIEVGERNERLPVLPGSIPGRPVWWPIGIPLTSSLTFGESNNVDGENILQCSSTTPPTLPPLRSRPPDPGFSPIAVRGLGSTTGA